MNEADSPNPAPTSTKTVRSPSALVILMGVVAAAAIATLILPQGSYERVEKNFPNLVPYTVVEGDDLETIRDKTGGDYTTLEELRLADPSEAGNNDSNNPASPTALTPGQELLIPRGGLTRTAVVPGTYTRTPEADRATLAEQSKRSAANVALAPIRGFTERAQIIGFVLILGGAFGLILATGAIDHGLRWAVLVLGNGRAKWAVVPVSFTLFSFGGASFGMGESTIAFVLITIPLALRLGYDTITGVAMCYMASQVGFAGAFFNPFTVGIAQGIAELPYLSGSGFRYVMWAIVTLVGIAFTMWWARRVERDPTKSPTYTLDQLQREKLGITLAHTTNKASTPTPPPSPSQGEGRGEGPQPDPQHASNKNVITRASETETPPPPTFLQTCVIVIAFGSIFLSGYGVAYWDWYIDEMAALFFVCAILCGVLSRFGTRRMADEFVKGTAIMVEPCLIIAVSAGIVMVLQQGQVLDTILHGLATPLQTVAPEVGAVALMGVQAVLNFFVPSGSGQAAMTMPIVTPLCDLIGLDRQVGVLAFQFGDGFGNIIIPTSAVLMGVLGVARIPWTTWLRWVWPLLLTLHVIGAILLIVAINGPESWLR
ncbi:TIGR00366 family protein [Phycisphaeraceae bacterium D3-23]